MRQCRYLSFPDYMYLKYTLVYIGYQPIRTATPTSSATGEPLAADEPISVSAARLRGTASCNKSVAAETHADGLLGRAPFSKPGFEGVWLRLAARLGHFVTPSVARYPAPFVRHLHSFLCFNMPTNTRQGLKAQKAARAAAEAKRAAIPWQPPMRIPRAPGNSPT